jgi:hypothetical protein
MAVNARQPALLQSCLSPCLYFTRPVHKIVMQVPLTLTQLNNLHTTSKDARSMNFLVSQCTRLTE